MFFFFKSNAANLRFFLIQAFWFLLKIMFWMIKISRMLTLGDSIKVQYGSVGRTVYKRRILGKNCLSGLCLSSVRKQFSLASWVKQNNNKLHKYKSTCLCSWRGDHLCAELSSVSPLCMDGFCCSTGPLRSRGTTACDREKPTVTHTNGLSFCIFWTASPPLAMCKWGVLSSLGGWGAWGA